MSCALSDTMAATAREVAHEPTWIRDPVRPQHEWFLGFVVCHRGASIVEASYSFIDNRLGPEALEPCRVVTELARLSEGRRRIYPECRDHVQ